MNNTQSPARAKKGLPVWILAVAVVMLLALLSGCGSSGSSKRSSSEKSSDPKTVAEKFVKACLDFDVDKIDSLSAYDFKAYLLDDYDGDEREFFEDISDWLDEDVTSWKSLSKAMKAYLQEELEDEYGKYSIEIEATKLKELSEKKLRESFGEWRYENLEDFDFNPDKVKSGAEVTVKIKLNGEDGKDSETILVYLAKIGGSWKVLTAGDLFF